MQTLDRPRLHSAAILVTQLTTPYLRIAPAAGDNQLTGQICGLLLILFLVKATQFSFPSFKGSVFNCWRFWEETGPSSGCVLDCNNQPPRACQWTTVALAHKHVGWVKQAYIHPTYEIHCQCPHSHIFPIFIPISVDRRNKAIILCCKYILLLSYSHYIIFWLHLYQAASYTINGIRQD